MKYVGNHKVGSYFHAMYILSCVVHNIIPTSRRDDIWNVESYPNVGTKTRPKLYKVDLLFVQFIIVQFIFVQRFSSNPFRQILT